MHKFFSIINRVGAIAFLSAYAQHGFASQCYIPTLKEKTEAADLIVEGKIGSIVEDDTGYVAAVLNVDQVKKGDIPKKELTVYDLPIWKNKKRIAGYLKIKPGEKRPPIFSPTTEYGVGIEKPYRFYLRNHKKIPGAYQPVECNTSELLSKESKNNNKK